jgi:mRNA-degrading endonuclease RelE of RelBE toxin-antitoxin system
MKINEIEISEGNISELQDVYQRLLTDFPSNELKDYQHFESLLVKKKYKLLLAKLKGKIVGYALIYEFDHMPAIWVYFFSFNDSFVVSLLVTALVASAASSIVYDSLQVQLLT